MTFGYGNEENENLSPILRNLSFTIEPNQRVALVGPTGCGKTTLAKLLLRLYEPQSGMILLDGKDIRDYPLNLLRTHIGYIEQDIYLFSRTIKENIAFGKPTATQEEILGILTSRLYLDVIPDKNRNSFYSLIPTLVLLFGAPLTWVSGLIADQYNLGYLMFFLFFIALTSSIFLIGAIRILKENVQDISSNNTLIRPLEQ
ncbi:unnamed protein product [marine sediment metagenome]|uniref:AAA+ ATPase domain-containing protein n=1 Tax=marine sediment metagenome TaxID=412755 RepID=X1BNN0_9ZZZZ